MEKTTKSTVTASTDAQRAALVSPVRLEILGLFTGPEPLAIADMAQRMGRPAGSLYHHVGILEKAGLLRRAGTRPKGKRFEALFAPTGRRVEMEAEPGDTRAAAQAVQAMRAAFRMTVRDLEAALENPAIRTEGEDRNTMALRVHLRASPRMLAELNSHVTAILDLLGREAASEPEPGDDDQHLSLTLALLPLRGRGDSTDRKDQAS